ncbi:HTH-type transcriptional repressor CarH [Armatimonadota bacterium]|nr:HTH-type transcriptional repressor CarH [Armatimonadota bacterium]
MHTIKFVASHTGLSPHVIRAWERRYNVLTPDRTLTNRRLYTDEDVEKLLLLRKAVQSGHSIGQIAALPLPELHQLLLKHSPEVLGQSVISHSAVQGAEGGDSYLGQGVLAVQKLNSEGLDLILRQATISLGTIGMMEHLLLPLLEYIGEAWREGEVRVAQEHMASAVLRTFLGRMLDSTCPPELAPFLVVTTPTGQVHELGALIVAVTAVSEGWRVLYLGANLPAEEIAGAVHHVGARGAALSIVYPPDDPRLPNELVNLRRGLGEGVAVLVGGRSAEGYRETLDRIGATLITDMKETRAELENLRRAVKS